MFSLTVANLSERHADHSTVHASTVPMCSFVTTYHRRLNTVAPLNFNCKYAVHIHTINENGFLHCQTAIIGLNGRFSRSGTKRDIAFLYKERNSCEMIIESKKVTIHSWAPTYIQRRGRECMTPNRIHDLMLEQSALLAFHLYKLHIYRKFQRATRLSVNIWRLTRVMIFV